VSARVASFVTIPRHLCGSTQGAGLRSVFLSTNDRGEKNNATLFQRSDCWRSCGLVDPCWPRRTHLNALQKYLKDVAEPSFRDFQQNPRSVRLAYQACVATYHAIDRVTFPKNPGNLRKKWREKSINFLIVDMVAHKFKHLISDVEKQPVPPGTIPLQLLVFGKGTLNSFELNATMFGEGGIDLHNLYFVIRDAIKFLNDEALLLPGANTADTCQFLNAPRSPPPAARSRRCPPLLARACG
jgi:hypothetical protein